MSLKSMTLLAAIAAGSMAGTSAVLAHDAGQVVHELRSKGYYHIDVVDPYLPKIQIDACKDGVRWHLHANYYGDIYHREHAGRCGGGYRDGHDPRAQHRRDGWDY